MLNNKGFDLWADNYDNSTQISDNENTYPFAGYNEILDKICKRALGQSGKRVLDIGFGTGKLTYRLYKEGCEIYGQDFSERMLELAREKMPKAELFCGDFSFGLANELTKLKYDSIIAAYSLHHLDDNQKITFINSLLELLNSGGIICIGDVAFRTRHELELCKAQSGNDWDNDEFYFVYDEFLKYFPKAEFERVSFCSGIFCLKKPFV